MRIPGHTLLLLALASGLTVAPTTAAPAPHKAGTVTDLEGPSRDIAARFRVLRNGRPIPVAGGMKLYGGDRVAALMEGYCLRIEVWVRRPNPALVPVRVCRSTGEWQVAEPPGEDPPWERAIGLITDGLQPDRGRDVGRPGSRRREPKAMLPITVTGADNLQARTDQPVVVWRAGQAPFSLVFRSGGTEIAGTPWNGDPTARAGRPARPLSPGSWIIEVTDARGFSSEGRIRIAPGAPGRRPDRGVGVAAAEALCLRFESTGQLTDATDNLLDFEALPESRSVLEILAEDAPATPLDDAACRTILAR